MHYEINVSKRVDATQRYAHYFATAERSITDESKAKATVEHFRQLFPEPEYNVTCTRWMSSGEEMDW